MVRRLIDIDKRAEDLDKNNLSSQEEMMQPEKNEKVKRQGDSKQVVKNIYQEEDFDHFR